MSKDEQLRAAFVTFVPGLAASVDTSSERAAELNATFTQFVVGNPSLDELAKGCEQYLEYAKQEQLGSAAGFEVPCQNFLAYVWELRAAADKANLAAAPGPDNLPLQIVQHDVQWYSAADASGAVTRLHTSSVTSVDLSGAPIDALDSDTISAEAARALASGLASNKGTLATLALTDMKIGTAGLCTVLRSLDGSSALRRLKLSNLCSRWTVTNTLGSERGGLLSELIRGWVGLESVVLADCTLADGCSHVAGALAVLDRLREVDLSYNEMDETAALTLAKSLQGKAWLESVALDGNEIGPVGLDAIKGTLRALGKLGVLRCAQS